MPDSQPAPSRPVPARFLASKGTILLDRFMTRAIQVGGLGIIVAVFGIFVFILMEILPLFGGAKAHEDKSFKLGIIGQGVLGVDEWAQKPFFYDGNAVRLADLTTPENKVDEQIPVLPEGAKPICWWLDTKSNRVTVGTEDGRIGSFKVQYASKLFFLYRAMPDHPGPHILSRFDQDLEALRIRVATMSSLALRNLDNVRTGLLKRDVERSNMVIADDEEMDILERGISTEATSLIMRFQPVALDLRLVIATIKVSCNLARMEDHVASMARRARKLPSLKNLPETEMLDTLVGDSGKFLAQVVNAFLERNPVSLNLLEPACLVLTRRAQGYADTVTERISYEVGQAVNACIDLIHVAKHLEQILSICRGIGLDTHFAMHPEVVLKTTSES